MRGSIAALVLSLFVTTVDATVEPPKLLDDRLQIQLVASDPDMLDLKDKGDIELFTLDAKTTRFKGTDIAAHGTLKQFLMPDGLEAAMTVTDFRDLVAFLSSRK